MPNDRIRLAVIIGSIRAGRFGPTVAAWFTREANRDERFDIDVIDLAEANLPAVITSELAPDEAVAIGAVTPRLDAADAFVIVTPEYNHSFPAALKNAIDWHFVQWQAKPVAFVSYGGLAGGLRAVEHLRQIFCELHAVTVRDTISFHGGAYEFNENGEPKDVEGSATAAKVMLEKLSWWAIALRDARAKVPYNS